VSNYHFLREQQVVGTGYKGTLISPLELDFHRSILYSIAKVALDETSTAFAVSGKWFYHEF